MVAMTTAINERRQEHRYEGIYAEYGIMHSAQDPAPSEFKASFLRNFSHNGASLLIHDRPPKGVFIKLRLYEPHSARPVELLGGIVWIERSAETPLPRERFNVGMKFLNVDDDLQRRLDLMVQYFEAEKNR